MDGGVMLLGNVIRGGVVLLGNSFEMMLDFG